ncbi:MAG: tetratricopeptide repeat-containing serine protease family protein [Xanthobacteraceae bacterium]
MVAVATLLRGVAAAQGAETFSGSGVVIGAKGEILTNAHVVEACQTITVKFSSGNSKMGVLVASDERNDFAVVRLTGTNNPPASVASFREGAPLRAGDAIVALGYPLSGVLAAEANVSVGNVSALSGIADDSRYLQISAPVQPGNSGGPLLDASGHLVGIVTAKLNAVRVARFTGDIPQNVNFALKAEVARTFLDNKGIAYQTARSDQQLSPADVGDIARPFTVHIECEQAGFESATAPPIASPALPNRIEPTQQQIGWCKGSGEPSPDLMIDGCTAVIQSGPRAWAFNNRGSAYGRKGDYDRAIADCTEAIRLDPKYAHAYNNRGFAYHAKGDNDRAIADYNEAIRLDPKYALPYNNRGFAYLAKGDHDRAIADYNEAIRLDPKDAHAYNNRGLAYDGKGDHDRAIGDYTEAIRLDPKKTPRPS